MTFTFRRPSRPLIRAIALCVSGPTALGLFAVTSWLFAETLGSGLPAPFMLPALVVLAAGMLVFGFVSALGVVTIPTGLLLIACRFRTSRGQTRTPGVLR